MNNSHFPMGARLALQLLKCNQSLKVFLPCSACYVFSKIFLFLIKHPVGLKPSNHFTDNKLRWPHIGPTWILSAPHWANVGPTCLVIWVAICDNLVPGSLPTDHPNWWIACQSDPPSQQMTFVNTGHPIGCWLLSDMFQDDDMTRKHFLHSWLFVRGIYWSPMYTSNAEFLCSLKLCLKELLNEFSFYLRYITPYNITVMITEQI